MGIRDSFVEEQELRGRAYSAYQQPGYYNHRSSSFDPAYGPGVGPGYNPSAGYDDVRFREGLAPPELVEPRGRGRGGGFLGSFFSRSPNESAGYLNVPPGAGGIPVGMNYGHHRSHSLEPGYERPIVRRDLSPVAGRRYGSRDDESVTKKLVRAVVENHYDKEDERYARRRGANLGVPGIVEPGMGIPPASFGQFERFQTNEGLYRYRSPDGRFWDHVMSREGVPYMRTIDPYGQKQYVKLPGGRSPSRGGGGRGFW